LSMLFGSFMVFYLMTVLDSAILTLLISIYAAI